MGRRGSSEGLGAKGGAARGVGRRALSDGVARRGWGEGRQAKAVGR